MIVIYSVPPLADAYTDVLFAFNVETLDELEEALAACSKESRMLVPPPLTSILP